MTPDPVFGWQGWPELDRVVTTVVAFLTVPVAGIARMQRRHGSRPY